MRHPDFEQTPRISQDNDDSVSSPIHSRIGSPRDSLRRSMFTTDPRLRTLKPIFQHPASLRTLRTHRRPSEHPVREEEEEEVGDVGQPVDMEKLRRKTKLTAKKRPKSKTSSRWRSTGQ